MATIGDDRVALLLELKASLLAAIADARTPNIQGSTQPSAVAALSKELRAVQGEIDQAAVKGEVSKADELAKRRAVRRADTPNPATAGRRSQPRRSSGSHRTG